MSSTRLQWSVALAGLGGAAALASGCGGETARCSFYSGFETGDGYGLTWSPTGAEIAYGYADKFPPDIYIVKVESSPQRLPKPLSLVAHGKRKRLSNGNCASANPSWSPDGRRIAYAGNHEHHAPYDVWVMKDDGSGAHLVARGRGSDTGGDAGNQANAAGPKPDWSPDGQRLAFDTKDAAGVLAVWLVRPDGRGLRRLTPPTLSAESPSWSPDGRRIAFSAGLAGAPAGIWVIDTDGSHARQLTRGGDSEPAWSPDGRQIAFDRALGDLVAVSVVPATAGYQSRAKVLTLEGYSPEWSPDGHWIAFISKRDGAARLYVMDANGVIERPIFSD